MGRPRASLDEVRKQFTDVGHTPIFADEDYVDAQTKLSFICGSCGSESATSRGSLRSNKSTGPRGCEHCYRDAKAKASWTGSYEEAKTVARHFGFTPLFRKSEYAGVFKKNLRVRCGTCAHESVTSLQRLKRLKGIGCGNCYHGKNSTKEITTRDGTFHSYTAAASFYGLIPGLVANRKREGWTDEEACGLVSRPLRVDRPGQTSWVYGWWSIALKRYVYVGLTTTSIKQRTSAHVRTAALEGSTQFHQLLAREGAAAFEVRQLWEGPIEEVQEAERHFVAKKRTGIEHGGYNQARAGSIGVRMGNRVNYRGTVFSTAREFAKHVDLPYGWVLIKLRAGMSAEEIVKARSELPEVSRGSVSVRGVTYPHLTAACAAFGTTLGSVHYHMNRGLTLEQALSPKVRVTLLGVEYPSARAAWEASGIDIKLPTFMARLRKNWTPEQALGIHEHPNQRV